MCCKLAAASISVQDMKHGRATVWKQDRLHMVDKYAIGIQFVTLENQPTCIVQDAAALFHLSDFRTSSASARP
jgi:hypothetical protein